MSRHRELFCCTLFELLFGSFIWYCSTFGLHWFHHLLYHTHINLNGHTTSQTNKQINKTFAKYLVASVLSYLLQIKSDVLNVCLFRIVNWVTFERNWKEVMWNRENEKKKQIFQNPFILNLTIYFNSLTRMNMLNFKYKYLTFTGNTWETSNKLSFSVSAFESDCVCNAMRN